MLPPEALTPLEEFLADAFLEMIEEQAQSLNH